MAYREVTMLEIKEILRLWLRGVGKKTVARRMVVDPKTVRRYVGVAEQCGLKAGDGESALTEELLSAIALALDRRPERPRGESWAECERHREFIEEKLDQAVRLTKVRRLLVRRGVEVPYATLHRYAVSELGFGRQAPTVPIADCEPGQELQVDTGWMGYLVADATGKRRRFRAWIFTAVRSRHRFVYPCFRETTHSAIEACEAAWEFFGGVFMVLIPDNPKALVVDADPLTPRINQDFLEYSQSRGFEIDPTRTRRPRDKARVERAVRGTREDCFGGESFYDLGGARDHARRWCLHDYGRRRHTRTQRMPAEQFLTEEQSCLLPAPSEPYDIPQWSSPKVARDHFALVDKAVYTLPTIYIGKTLRARADSQTVRFYLGRKLVKTHPRQPEGGRAIDNSDFPPDKAVYARRDVGYLLGQARQHGSAIGRFAEAVLEGPLPWTRMRRVYALLGLCKRFGDERVEQTCESALAAEMLDIWRLRRMLELGPPRSKPPTTDTSPKVVPMARYLRPASQYSLPRGDDQPEDEEQSEEGEQP